MEKSWFISRNGEQLGPYSWDEIVRQAEEGSLNPQEYIWSEGMKDWQSAQSMEGLFKAPEPAVDTPPPVSPQPVRPAMKRTAPKKNVMLPVVIAVAAILLVVGGVYAFSTLMQQAGSQNGVDETSEDWREHWPNLDEIQGLMAMRNGEQPLPVNGEPPDDETPPPGGGTPPPGGGGTPTSGNPVARIRVTPLAPRAGDPVTFSGHDSSSSSSGGQITNYSWVFSDGISGTGVSFQRAFGSSGIKTVSLTVTDEQGKTGSTSSNIIVMSAGTGPPANGDDPPANGGDPPANGDDPPPSGSNGGGTGRTGFFGPTAKFTFSPAEPVVDQTVTFDASASSSLIGRITKYEWVVGDSLKRFSSATPTMTRSFTSSGTYSVTLTVTNNSGETDSFTRKVKVTEGSAGTRSNDIIDVGSSLNNVNLITGFSFNPAQPMTGESVRFFVETGLIKPIGLKYEWRFGSGGARLSDTRGEYNWIFNMPGRQEVTLIVSDINSNTKEFKRNVLVNVKPSRIRLVVRYQTGIPGNSTIPGQRYFTNNTIEIRHPTTGQVLLSRSKRLPSGDQTYGFTNETFNVAPEDRIIFDEAIPSEISQLGEFTLVIRSSATIIIQTSSGVLTEGGRIRGVHEKKYNYRNDFQINDQNVRITSFRLLLETVNREDADLGSVRLSTWLELYNP